MSLTSSRALSFSKKEVKKSSLSINPGPTQRTSTSAPVNKAQVHMRGKSTLCSEPPSSPFRGGNPPLTEPHTATSHIVTDCEWTVWSLIMNHTGQSHRERKLPRSSSYSRGERKTYLLSGPPDERSQTGRFFLRLCPSQSQVRSKFKTINQIN